MYRYFCMFIILLFVSPVMAGTRTIVTRTPYNPYYGAYYGGDYIPGRLKNNSSMFGDINDLERYAMNKNFTRDSDLARIERLEMQAFGAVQQGDIVTRYDNVRDAILTRPKQNYKTSLWQGISNYFNGQLTGYTPPINQPFYNYNYPYGRSVDSGYITPYGRRYSTSRYGIGSGSGVHILD